MRDRINHVAGIHQPDRPITLPRTAAHIRAIQPDIDPVRVGCLSRAAGRVVVLRRRDGRRILVVDDGQRGNIHAPAYAVDLNPALGSQVFDQNPGAVDVAREGLHPRPQRKLADSVILKAGAAAHIDPGFDAHPVDIGGRRRLALGEGHQVRQRDQEDQQAYQTYQKNRITMSAEHRILFDNSLIECDYPTTMSPRIKNIFEEYTEAAPLDAAPGKLSYWCASGAARKVSIGSGCRLSDR